MGRILKVSYLPGMCLFVFVSVYCSIARAGNTLESWPRVHIDGYQFSILLPDKPLIKKNQAVSPFGIKMKTTAYMSKYAHDGVVLIGVSDFNWKASEELKLKAMDNGLIGMVSNDPKGKVIESTTSKYLNEIARTIYVKNSDSTFTRAMTFFLSDSTNIAILVTANEVPAELFNQIVNSLRLDK